MLDNDANQIFTSVKDRTVVGAVRDQLIILIRSGQLKPGQKLPTEAELGYRLSVSRTTIREAIRSLVGEGLLEVRRGQGTFISTLDSSTAINREVLSMLLVPENIREIQDARRLLEPEILKYFISNANDKAFDELNKLLNNTEEMAKQGQSLFEMSWEFHRQIAKFAGQSVLAIILNVIYEMIREAERPIYDTYFDPFDDVESHRYLLRVLQKKNNLLARKAILQHLDDVEQKINQAFLPKE